MLNLLWYSSDFSSVLLCWKHNLPQCTFEMSFLFDSNLTLFRLRV